MRTLLAFLLLALACRGETEVTPPELDPTLNGTWTAAFGAVTVRYDLVDRDGAVTGDLSMVAPDAFEGGGTVTGSRTGTRVTLDAPVVVVQVDIDVEINSGVAFIGTLLGDRITGEFTFEGGDAPAGTDEAGRPIGVRLTEFVTPITLVRR